MVNIAGVLDEGMNDDGGRKEGRKEGREDGSVVCTFLK
jgi:hypothetical protein